MYPVCQTSDETHTKCNNIQGHLPRSTWSTTEAVSALSFVHPGPRVGPVGWRVEPGHAAFCRAAKGRQVLVLCADWAAELLVVALVPTATWKRRWEKNDESGDWTVRDRERGQKAKDGRENNLIRQKWIPQSHLASVSHNKNLSGQRTWWSRLVRRSGYTPQYLPVFLSDYTSP